MTLSGCLLLLLNKGKGSSLPLTLANFEQGSTVGLTTFFEANKIKMTLIPIEHWIVKNQPGELIGGVHRIIGLQFSRGNRTGRKEIEYVPETQ